jgi:hypothetical protein
MRRAVLQAWRAVAALVPALLLTTCTSSAPSAAPSKAQTPTRAEPTAVSASTVVPTATRPAVTPTRPATTAPTGAAPATSSNRAEVTFRFVQQLSTPEEVDEIGAVLKQTPGILDVFGDERQITIGYDPALRTPEQIREQLGAVRHPVQ